MRASSSNPIPTASSRRPLLFLVVARDPLLFIFVGAWRPGGCG
jgi:hypothetical protein